MDKFIQDAKVILGLHLSKRQVSDLKRYEEELLSWNTRFNLTAIRDAEGIRTRHFLDSLSCLLAFRDSQPGRLIDIGTGAGFPGLPIKIVLPHIRLVLVDSVGKKADFCRHIVQELALEQVDVIQSRAEDVGQSSSHREQYDCALARAVANLPVLVEYLLPLVRVGGMAIAQKGTSGPAETQQAETGIRMLGGQIRSIKEVCLPGIAEERYLVVLDKVAATPPRYPRRAGIPAKTPL